MLWLWAPYVLAFFMSCTDYASAAVSIGSYTKIADGVYDAWKTANEENVGAATGFKPLVSRDKLWIINSRCYSIGTECALQAGIVSTLQLNNNVWTHKTYDRLNVDPRFRITFLAANRPFVLAYSHHAGGLDSREVTFHKLFFWDTVLGSWTETPLEVTNQAISIGNYGGYKKDILAISPSADSLVVYITTSSHSQYSPSPGDSIFDFWTLQLQMQGNNPFKATLKPIIRKLHQFNAGLRVVLVKNDKLYAFESKSMRSPRPYWNRYDTAITIDVKTKVLSNTPTSGASHNINAYIEENCFQYGNYAFMFENVLSCGGGNCGGGRGYTKSASLNLNNMQWTEEALEKPSERMTFDKATGKLYTVSLRDGVSVAQVTINEQQSSK